MNDLICRSTLWDDLDNKTKIAVLRYAKKVKSIILNAPTVDAVEVGNCEGRIWENRKRPQKCSCCRRNPDMKDCYMDLED